MSESDWFIFGVLSAIAIALFFIWWQSRRIANQLRNSTFQQELNIQHGIRSTRRSNWLIYIWFFIGSVSIIAALFILPRKNGSDNSENVAITVLSIFVTFLVAWQIWQTISSHDEIKEMREDALQLKDNYNALNLQISNGLEKNKRFGLAVWHYGKAQDLRLSANKDEVEVIREAYFRYFEAIVEFLKSYPEDYIDRCIEGMKLCQSTENAFTYSENYDKTFVERCDKLFEEVEKLYSLIDKSHKEAIKELNQIRNKYHNRHLYPLTNSNGTERK